MLFTMLPHIKKQMLDNFTHDDDDIDEPGHTVTEHVDASGFCHIFV